MVSFQRSDRPVDSMATFISVLALATLLRASPIPEGVLTDIAPIERGPIGCSIDHDGPFAIAVERIQSLSHRHLQSRQEPHLSDPPMLSQIQDGQIQAPGIQPPSPVSGHGKPCSPDQPGCQDSKDSQPCPPDTPGCNQGLTPQRPSPLPSPPSTSPSICWEGEENCKPSLPCNHNPCTCGGYPSQHPCTCGGNPCTCSTSTRTSSQGRVIPTPPSYQPDSPIEGSNTPCRVGDSDCISAAPGKPEELSQPSRGGQPWCVSPGCRGTSCQPGQPGCGTIASQVEDGQVQVLGQGRNLLTAREITSNVTRFAELSDMIDTLDGAGPLVVKLEDGKLVDAHGRRGYIAGNRQFQFDNPPQSGSIYTSGFSVCKEGNLALGNSVVWHQCRSGDFYNIYDMDIAPQCESVRLVAVPIHAENEDDD